MFRRFSEKKRAYHVTGLLKQVRASIPRPMKLYVILDNHHMHTGALLKGFVESDGYVELVFTPKNASWWNAIEQIFADLQKRVLNNSSFSDVEEMKGAVKGRIPELSTRLKSLLQSGKYVFGLRVWMSYR